MKKHNILLVDDEPQILELLCCIIKDLAYLNSQITKVSSGEEAVLEMNKMDFDLVITDLNMRSHINGIKVLLHARTLGLQPEVIIMTGSYNLKSFIEAVKYNANDFILKPFPLKKMRKSISDCLNHQSQTAVNNDLERPTALYYWKVRWTALKRQKT